MANLRKAALVVLLAASGTRVLTASTITFSGTSASAIPDNNTTGLVFNITVPGWGLINSVRIDIKNFTHSWVGDLVFTLQKVSGTGASTGAVAYLNRLGVGTATCPSTFGCSSNLGLNGNTTVLGTYTWADGGASLLGLGNINSNNYLIPFGTYAPASALNSSFAGINTQGVWQLVFKDLANSDTSNSGWTYTVTFDATIPEASSYALVGGGLVLFGLWRQRRRAKPTAS